MTMKRRIVRRMGGVLTCALIMAVNPAMGDAASDYEMGARAYDSEDLVNAMQYLERAASQGHAQAMLLLGYIFDKAEENETAAAYYRRSAEAGNAGGAYALGTMYASGDGVERDFEKARSWYQQAADMGHAPALETLGIAHVEGGLGLEKDAERGGELLRQAAERSGESSGQNTNFRRNGE